MTGLPDRIGPGPMNPNFVMTNKAYIRDKTTTITIDKIYRKSDTSLNVLSFICLVKEIIPKV